MTTNSLELGNLLVPFLKPFLSLFIFSYQLLLFSPITLSFIPLFLILPFDSCQWSLESSSYPYFYLFLCCYGPLFTPSPIIWYLISSILSVICKWYFSFYLVSLKHNLPSWHFTSLGWPLIVRASYCCNCFAYILSTLVSFQHGFFNFPIHNTLLLSRSLFFL